MQSFADALVANINNSKYRDLNFGGNGNLTEMGWATLIAVPHNPNSVVKKLHLNNNNTSINDNIIQSFPEVFNGLLEWSICSNAIVTPAEWMQLSMVIRNPISMLEK
jgi:hypothetical protein